jgi:hypothetical protein
MESDYGQFVYLDENNNFEDDIGESIIVKDNCTSLKTNIFLNNDSMLIMFVEYLYNLYNLVEYYYKK